MERGSRTAGGHRAVPCIRLSDPVTGARPKALGPSALSPPSLLHQPAFCVRRGQPPCPDTGLEVVYFRHPRAGMATPLASAAAAGRLTWSQWARRTLQRSETHYVLLSGGCVCDQDLEGGWGECVSRRGSGIFVRKLPFPPPPLLPSAQPRRADRGEENDGNVYYGPYVKGAFIFSDCLSIRASSSTPRPPWVVRT